MKKINVTICGVPYEMSIVDGGVMFSNKSGFWGVAGRFMFEYRSALWYMIDVKNTFDQISLSHLVRMSDLIEKHIHGNFEPNPKLEFKGLDHTCFHCKSEQVAGSFDLCQSCTGK